MNNWTHEEFDLLTEKLIERNKRESDAIHGRNTTPVEVLPIITGGKISYHKETKEDN